MGVPAVDKAFNEFVEACRRHTIESDVLEAQMATPGLPLNHPFLVPVENFIELDKKRIKGPYEKAADNFRQAVKHVQEEAWKHYQDAAKKPEWAQHLTRYQIDEAVQKLTEMRTEMIPANEHMGSQIKALEERETGAIGFYRKRPSKGLQEIL